MGIFKDTEKGLLRIHSDVIKTRPPSCSCDCQHTHVAARLCLYWTRIFAMFKWPRSMFSFRSQSHMLSVLCVFYWAPKTSVNVWKCWSCRRIDCVPWLCLWLTGMRSFQVITWLVFHSFLLIVLIKKALIRVTVCHWYSC